MEVLRCACAAGVRLVTFLLAMALTAPLHAQETGSIGVSVTMPAGAWQQVYLVPKRRANQRSSLGVIELPARQRASETAYFQGDIEPGDYLLGAEDGGTFQPVDPALPALRVVAGRHTDFGRVWVDTLGGNRSLLMRDAAAPANAAVFPGAPGDAAQGWVLPVGTKEQALLERARRRVLIPAMPVELADGSWMSWSRKGGVLLRDPAGQWRTVARLPDGHRLAAAHGLSPIDYVLADEFGALYRGGLQVEPVGQLPAGRVQSLQCTPTLACTALLERDEGQVAVHTRDATAGNWVEIAQFPKAHSVLMTIVVYPRPHLPGQAHAEALPGMTVLAFKKTLWIVELASGNVRQAEIPSLNANYVQADGDVLQANGHFSRDGGLTWQKVDTGILGGLLHLGRDDAAFVVRENFDFEVGNFELRRQVDGQWRTVSELPAVGGLRVGRASRVMYLADFQRPDRVWISIDDGANWSADRQLQTALEAM